MEFITTWNVKYIPGYEQLYSISEEGEVFSHKSNKFLMGSNKSVTLTSKNGVTKSFRRDKLIHLTYCLKEISGKEVINMETLEIFESEIEASKSMRTIVSNTFVAIRIRGDYHRHEWAHLTPKIGIYYNKLKTKYENDLKILAEMYPNAPEHKLLAFIRDIKD